MQDMLFLKSLSWQFISLLLCIVKISDSHSQNGNSNDLFTCAGKVIGGYYADIHTQCRTFHVCTIGEKGEIRDFVFRCLNGTVFDQETRVCEREEEVDCSKSQSFFGLNNELYGPGIIPETAYRFSLKRDHRPTERDHLTIQMDAPSMCKGMNSAIFYSHPENDCNLYSLCIPQYAFSEMLVRFKCADKCHVFDQRTRLCVHRNEVSPCSVQNQAHEISIKEAEILAVYTLGTCSLFKGGSLMADPLTSCQQYFQCPLGDERYMVVHRCPNGFLFSHQLQKCIEAHNVACNRETFSLFKFIEVQSYQSPKNQINEVGRPEIVRVHSRFNAFPLFFRHKRGLNFESDIPTTDPMSDITNVFHSQSSVVDSSKNGNGFTFDVEGEFPKTTISSVGSQSLIQDHIKRILNKSRKIHSLQPETSLALNKQTLNGTIIEVSEIASPDKQGKVTITSIVPKIVNQNGNGGISNKRTSLLTPTAVTNRGTKITLIGSNSPDPFATGNVTADSKAVLNTIGDFKDGNLTQSKNLTDEFAGILVSNENSSLSLSNGGDYSELIDGENFTTENLELSTTTVSPNEISTIYTSNYSSTIAATTAHVNVIDTSAKTGSIEPETGSPAEEGSHKTNFTCKDKELEQFYPDIEHDCRLFHYCSPGFTDAEVLDLTFVCSGATRFDIKTKKCQETSTVICGEAHSTSKVTISTTSVPVPPSSSSAQSTFASSTMTSVSSTPYDASSSSSTVLNNSSTESSLKILTDDFNKNDSLISSSNLQLNYKNAVSNVSDLLLVPSSTINSIIEILDVENKSVRSDYDIIESNLTSKPEDEYHSSLNISLARNEDLESVLEPENESLISTTDFTEGRMDGLTDREIAENMTEVSPISSLSNTEYSLVDINDTSTTTTEQLSNLQHQTPRFDESIDMELSSVSSDMKLSTILSVTPIPTQNNDNASSSEAAQSTLGLMLTEQTAIDTEILTTISPTSNLSVANITLENL